uniref:Isoform 4 of ALS2 C-terminal-like protein n=1 Tax=Homo sapiens TaxID=9606 RepID=Q60I27-4|nr:unnamed protein product [Homo sapiens]
MLPSFYSELFTLYLLLHEREDSFYSQGIANLSLFPDTQLLEFLDVQKHLWPLKDLTLTSNQRYSLVRDKCFLSATECLQKIMTTVDPREKLEVLERTYGEIEGTVSRVLGREYKLPMDDLLPLLIYVVSRARWGSQGPEKGGSQPGCWGARGRVRTTPQVSSHPGQRSFPSCLSATGLFSLSPSLSWWGGVLQNSAPGSRDPPDP